ncbi:MAG TPA: hypothetical protein VFP35_04450 [Candidatus Saccharimonadales bacterium]|nr:hypothetical protein [Candidatus Saccharimonadales bacterium]
MSKVIVICSSGAFYEHANQVADELEKLGFKAVVPATARQMKASGDYDISKVKTWYQDPSQAPVKVSKMRGHFKEVDKGDAILLINDDKPGLPGYIGPNGFMEWGLAAYLGKPVFILNAVSKDSNYWEEALTATVLGGDLAKIKL